MVYLDGLTQSQVAQQLRTGKEAVGVAVANAMRVVAAFVESADASEQR